MSKSTKIKKWPHFNAGTWEPSLVEDFLFRHGFKGGPLDGDDALWIGKGPTGQDAQAAFPVMRRQLTPGTLRDSVMRQSKYSKTHWDYWRSLRKTDRRDRKCCQDLPLELL